MPSPSKYAPDKIPNSMFLPLMKIALMKAQRQTQKPVLLQLIRYTAHSLVFYAPGTEKNSGWGADFFCYVPVTIPPGVMCQLGRNGPIFSHDGQIKRDSTLEEH